jgi:capsular polysaccharide export protein
LCDAGIAQVLGVVDEVHTMTSLTGFEALLRNTPVTCYGKPFYSGWGLTADVVPATRKRQLSLDELVAGTLIQYPVYVSSVTGHYTTPERIVQELVAWRDHSRLQIPLWRRAYKFAMRTTKAINAKFLSLSSVPGLPPRSHTVETEIERSQ